MIRILKRGNLVVEDLVVLSASDCDTVSAGQDRVGANATLYSDGVAGA
jgi:hypothetical protein